MKKVSLITGAASGIGLATAKRLLREGICVVGMSRRPEMEYLGGDFTYVSGDVGNADDRKRFLDTALSKYGHVNILVNVAGVAPKVRSDLLEMTEESYDYVMNINTKGTLFLTQSAANEIGVADCHDLYKVYQYRDALICQTVCLSAMLHFQKTAEGTRGSALYTDPKGEKRGELEEIFRFVSKHHTQGEHIQQGVWTEDGCSLFWRDVRPLPDNNVESLPIEAQALFELKGE